MKKRNNWRLISFNFGLYAGSGYHFEVYLSILLNMASDNEGDAEQTISINEYLNEVEQVELVNIYSLLGLD